MNLVSTRGWTKGILHRRREIGTSSTGNTRHTFDTEPIQFRLVQSQFSEGEAGGRMVDLTQSIISVILTPKTASISTQDKVEWGGFIRDIIGIETHGNNVMINLGGNIKPS